MHRLKHGLSGEEETSRRQSELAASGPPNEQISKQSPIEAGIAVVHHENFVGELPINGNDFKDHGGVVGVMSKFSSIRLGEEARIYLDTVDETRQRGDPRRFYTEQITTHEALQLIDEGMLQISESIKSLEAQRGRLTELKPRIARQRDAPNAS